jgi:predicted ArsR family transcriptional regulator
MQPGLSDAKHRLLEQLVRQESATVAEMATALALTEAAVRQHVESLSGDGLVERVDHSSGPSRGRPPASWRVTPAAHALLPDRHQDLTLELIESVRAALGSAGLDAVLAERESRQLDRYRDVVGTGSVRVRLQRLARERSAEGYLAELIDDGDSTVLVENHCPIAAAAGACSGLCDSELRIFAAVLGDGATIERTQHLVAGDRRCAYRIASLA